MNILKSILLKLFSPLASIFYKQNQRNAMNLTLHLQKRALDSTAEYIEQNMSKVSSVRGQKNVLHKAINKVTIEGLYCEFGVCTGDTLNFLKNFTSKTFHGFDSFKGLPEFWRDGWDEKAFELEEIPKITGNVELHVGYFDESLPIFLKKHKEPFAFLHIDCDLYSAAKSIFTLAKERIVPGTVISFDEYFNYTGWQNDEFKAFQEFIANTGLNYEYLTYNSMQSQVAVIIKE